MKLFKFRSLKSCIEKEWVFNTLQTGEFYLAKWDDLNDPMEGYFYYPNSHNNTSVVVDKIINDKKKLRICCFCDNMKNILLWSHYAENHKGIAIQIDIEEDNEYLKKVNYEKVIPTFQKLKEMEALELLQTKIKLWKYEKEYRYIDERDKFKIGNIKAVYFGIRCSEENKIEMENKFKGEFKFIQTIPNFDKNIIIKEK